LIVENVELLVTEAENGLLDTLAAEPSARIEELMERWERTNPLVRTAFRARADGRLLRPAPDGPGADARNFPRRFEHAFGSRPPWLAPRPEARSTDETRERNRLAEEPATRQEVTKNVAQVQSARRDVQQLFKQDAPLASVPAADRVAAEKSRVADGAAAAGAAPPLSAFPTTASASAEAVRPAAASARKTEAADAALQEGGPARRGWTPVSIDGRLQLFGWVLSRAAGEVRGVEMDPGALVAKLGGLLPGDSAVGEGYALRDERGRILHQAGVIPESRAPAVRVPLALALLPGWDVVAFLAGPSVDEAGAAGWLGVAGLLLGVFVAAILAGGALLFRQAQRSDEEAAQKTSFVANVSHEFKTPLTTIRLYAELLEQGRVRDAAQGGEYLRTIARETQRLARLVNNALDFSRLEQGRKKFAREPVDLAAELARLLAGQAPRLAEAGLELHRELPRSPLQVGTDRDAFEQIVLNLMDNACKYAAGGGEVTVTLTERERGGAVLRVADRGPGVPEEHRERIFEKFHRVSDNLTAEKAGTGLGLSIARQLARGLGGELTCRSRDGGGAEFVLELT
jgi:signal transduction histidine kinase